MLGYIEDLPVESLLDLAPMTQLEHLELAVRGDRVAYAQPCSFP